MGARVLGCLLNVIEKNKEATNAYHRNQKGDSNKQHKKAVLSQR